MSEGERLDIPATPASLEHDLAFAFHQGIEPYIGPWRGGGD